MNLNIYNLFFSKHFSKIFIAKVCCNCWSIVSKNAWSVKD